MKKIIGIILLIISLVFLALGLLYPFMTLKFEFAMSGIFSAFMGSGMEKELNKTYSIPQVMNLLFKHGYHVVALLIGLFAVVIPIIKTIMTFILLFNSNKKLYNFIGHIGKFAMADVFCVGVLIAFLYTSFNQGVKVKIMADIELGYYFFTAYVLLNIISLFLLKPKEKQLVN